MSEFSLFSKFHTEIINISNSVSVLTVVKVAYQTQGKYDIYFKMMLLMH